MGIVAGIVAATAIGVGASEIFGAASNQPKAPSAPALPDPNKATQDAKAQSDAQRKLLLASGGQTDYTGGNAVVGSGDINKTTLLGN